MSAQNTTRTTQYNKSKKEDNSPHPIYCNYDFALFFICEHGRSQYFIVPSIIALFQNDFSVQDIGIDVLAGIREREDVDVGKENKKGSFTRLFTIWLRKVQKVSGKRLVSGTYFVLVLLAFKK